MKHMIIVAHPDDEVLGLGGFIYDRIQRGDDVCVVIANEADIPTRPGMTEDLDRSHAILGIRQRYGLGLENLNVSAYSPVYVVPRMEQIIAAFTPDYIFTHAPGDINPDHQAVSGFVQQAARYYQRRQCLHHIAGLFFIEVLSSTDWGFDTFKPDTYLEISSEGLDRKIEALSCYQNVLRHDTHPRSERAIKALAAFRGCTMGVRFAEAVKTCWRIEQEGQHGEDRL